MQKENVHTVPCPFRLQAMEQESQLTYGTINQTWVEQMKKREKQYEQQDSDDDFEISLPKVFSPLHGSRLFDSSRCRKGENNMNNKIQMMILKYPSLKCFLLSMEAAYLIL